MTLYNSLLDKINTKARKRGPNKGCAPAQKDWALSAHNSKLQLDHSTGEILCWYEQTIVGRVTPDGVITLNCNGWQDASTTRNYVWEVLRLNITTQKPHGIKHTCVLTRLGHTPYYQNMQLKREAATRPTLLTPPRVFTGKRIAKAATKARREPYKLVYDSLPMYHLAHNGIPRPENQTSSGLHALRVELGYQSLWYETSEFVEAHLDDYLQLVLSEAGKYDHWLQSYEPPSLSQCRAYLNAQLSEYEDYVTDKYYLTK